MSCVSVIGSRDAIAVCSKRSPDGGVGSSRGIPSALVVASHIRRLRRSTSAPRTKKLTGAGALVGLDFRRASTKNIQLSCGRRRSGPTARTAHLARSRRKANHAEGGYRPCCRPAAFGGGGL